MDCQSCQSAVSATRLRVLHLYATRIDVFFRCFSFMAEDTETCEKHVIEFNVLVTISGKKYSLKSAILQPENQ